MPKFARIVKLLLVWTVVPVIVFLLCEGGASVALFVQTFNQTRPVAERLHTGYDPELGWVNVPNTHITDMYGPGRSVTINGQGFRSTAYFSAAVPPGKVRAVCVGDSFTFGFGVDDEQTWCRRLETLDARLETVNMGQGGYGIDQAYLWYKRDGGQIEHNLVLFGFINTDFERMQHDSFLGYGKPVLTVENDELVVSNVPVPRRPFALPWTTPTYQAAFNQLRSVQWLRRVFFPAPADTPPDSTQTADSEMALRHVSGKIVTDLQRVATERNSLPALVYLPTFADYRPNPQTDSRRRFAREGAADLGIPFIDLVEDFRTLPENDIGRLFIQPGEVDFPAAAGHYSAAGNEYIARQLLKQLQADPQLSPLLDSASR